MTTRRSISLICAPAFGERGSFVPLGLAYLNGALRQAGFEPAVVDANAVCRVDDPDLYGALVAKGFSPGEGGLFGPDLPVLLRLARPDLFDAGDAESLFAARIARRAALDADTLDGLVGIDLALITLWDSNLYYAAALGLVLRRRGARVVMGGPSAQLVQVRQLMTRLGCADAVVYGEGEDRVVQIARMVAAGSVDFAGVGGAALRLADESVVETPPMAALRIGALPGPDFTGFDIDDNLPLITSRGCIRDCSFCTEKFNWQRYRQRAVGDVLDEIEGMITRWGARALEFNDDLLNGHPRWLEQLLDGMIERRWGLRWTCFMEPYRLAPRVIDKLPEAGCNCVKFGVQHFDRGMLGIIGRGDEVEDVVDTLERTAAAGIRVPFDLVPGHPGETAAAHAVNTRMLGPLLARSPLLTVNVNPFLLLYGSPVQLHPQRYGVTIEHHDRRMLPAAFSESLGDLAEHFIASYQQSPPPAVVRARTEELEAIARSAASLGVPRAITAAHLGGRRGNEAASAATDSLSRAVRPGTAGVVLRPVPETTPRDLLAWITAARGQGVGSVALATPGPPLGHPGFVAAAVRSGLSRAILVLDGAVESGEVAAAPASAAAAAATMTAAGLPFEVAFDLVDCATVQHARRVTAAAVCLEPAQVRIDATRAVAACRTQSDVHSISSRARASLSAASGGTEVHVHGLPFCWVAEDAGALHSLPPVHVAELAHQRPIQPPRCRSCALSTRCDGLIEAALTVLGEGVLTPIQGRPAGADRTGPPPLQ